MTPCRFASTRFARESDGAEIKLVRVVFTRPASQNGEDRLHICCRWAGALRTRGRSCVLSHERSQNLTDGTMVLTGLAREALERVDASHTDFGFPVADLVDCACEALRDLPLAVQRERSRCIDRAHNGDTAGEQREQRRSVSSDLCRPLIGIETAVYAIQ